ncbi:DUF1330 domain-containing protein [Novosphingobium taihuense]|uniref:Uncharacterized protein (DUF1330 family) n=1 Tax=Novosphingobium taihuense TaxID=260085 RepID=A0A7W7EUT7_9SPHN|nr:DUF1330 domain-containing protein [Novosphingobium taihuense]MBB4614296.1 uncharacterized protein (DUF1330 family) [Novosphingobium taihuense]TWH87143.1 uncharacterized protein (DUF1330 family) [Novosphingobium taihuense]
MATRMIALLYAENMDWIPEYSANVPQMVAKYGGSYNFISTGEVKVLEGTFPAPTGIGIFDFPSVEAAQQFLDAEEYKPYLELRNKHSRNEIFAFDGREV